MSEYYILTHSPSVFCFAKSSSLSEGAYGATFPIYNISEPREARFIRFEVLSTTGKESEYPALLDQTVHIAELSVF